MIFSTGIDLHLRLSRSNQTNNVDGAYSKITFFFPCFAPVNSGVAGSNLGGLPL